MQKEQLKSSIIFILYVKQNNNLHMLKDEAFDIFYR